MNEKKERQRIRSILLDYRFGNLFRWVRNQYKLDLADSEGRKILDLFFKKILKEITFNLYEYNMFGLFLIRLEKYKVEYRFDENGKVKLPDTFINWKATREAGKWIYYDHDHTNGYRFYYAYKKHGKYKNKEFFSLRFYQPRRRELGRTILKEGNLPAYEGESYFTKREIERKRDINFKHKKQWYQSEKSFLESKNTHS